jgi:CheY-like chemotaxis protein
VLQLQGFEVDVAYTGPEGLAAARRLRPDAVVCDLGLPGMSGYDVAQALRADPTTASALLVSLSGYGQEADKQRARAAGFDETLVKPAEPDELARLLV